MSTRQKNLEPSPLFRPRDFIRMMSLLVAAGFILWAMVKASDPRTWQWVAVFQRRVPAAQIETEPPASAPQMDMTNLELQTAGSRTGGFLGLHAIPTLTPASFAAGVPAVLADEYVPLPAEEKTPAEDAKRHAPLPERRWLDGALDGEVFRDEDQTVHANDHKRDADARYHLLALAKEATLEQLAADARSNVRYTALMYKAREHRGEVIRIKGDLRWVRTFELQRPTPGMDFVYEGLIVVPGTGHSYGILFTDLPQHMPPERLWQRLRVRDVSFDGYFLKVLRVADRVNPERPDIPVLVGKSPILPEPPPPFDVYGTLSTIGLILAVAFILGTLALWLYRRSERRYQAKMAEVRARAQGRSPALTESGDQGAADFADFQPGHSGPPD